ncbi:site-specific integrase [Neiella marina]|uniref:Site-specific integrase n=1 Tax=Neiella holothuriorum TaxID=2870530 RepID=A0ABS7ECW9_9GAMM|nr:site-specific integrase [Neiella holothuriorum]MBW8189671.1 site-specific integrase [Neiella holothuriorum]
MPVTAKITNTSIGKLKPEDRRLNDSELKGFHARISPKGSISYYLYYRLDGKQVNFLLGRHGALTPAQARDLAKLKAGEVAAGVDVQEVKKENKQTQEREKLTRFATYVEHKYYPWLLAKGTKTAEKINHVLTNTFDFLADKQLSKVSAWDLEKWRAQRKKEGMAPATINYYISTLKGAMSRAVDWGLIEGHEIGKVKALKVDNTRVKYLSDREEKRLLAALQERDLLMKSKRESANEFRRVRHLELLPNLRQFRFADHIEPIVLLAMNTGMRRGEIFQLTWSAIDLSIPSLEVKSGTAKSGKGRHIPLNLTVLEMLKDWRKQTSSETYVFEGAEGKPLTDIKKGWAGVVKQAELVEFNFHDLRHHFASKLVMKGVDLNTVRELLGHADMKMTLRYAHLAPEHKAAAVSLL